MSKYTGFTVELWSDQLGLIVGTVQSYDSCNLELINAVVNDEPLNGAHYSVKREFIKSIRIIASCPESTVSVPESQFSSSRDHRRNRLRNIPNTCTAYVCSKSPPRVIKTQPASVDDGTKSQKCKKQMEKSLASFNLPSSAHERPFGVNGNSSRFFGIRNRSMSVGDGMLGSNMSGCESEPSTAYPLQKVRNRKNQNWHTFTRSDDSKNSSMSGWNGIRVEDFIDEDFDFEANLALFDKRAFYAKADSECATIPLKQRSLSVEKVLVEGPNGIGFVSRDRKLTTCSLGHVKPVSNSEALHSSPIPQSRKGAVISQDQVELVTNSMETCLNCQFSSNPQFSSEPRSVSLTKEYIPVKPFSWYSVTGQRVPVVSVAEHARLLTYLVTGQDAEFKSSSNGLGWGRIFETAGQSIVDAASSYIRQMGDPTLNRPQNSRAPLRVLVLASSLTFGGVLALNMARRLSSRGACVFLLPSPTPDTMSSTSQNTGVESIFSHALDTSDILNFGSIYRQELLLTKTLSPKPSSYGFHESCYEEGAESQSDEEENEQLACLNSSSDTSSQERTQAGRMWLSRLSGLKIVKNKSVLTCRPTNMAIDLMILSQPVDKFDQEIRNWICNHTAIGLAIQLSPDPKYIHADSNSLKKAQNIWFLQLGLPILSPVTFGDLAVSSVHLVDIGMTRTLVSRITGNLRVLPPINLFDSSSLLQLTDKK